MELIKAKKLCGSPNNKITVVFDGYAGSSGQELNGSDIRVVFSCKESADSRIKKMVEVHSNPKNVVVVSDDKEIKFFIRALGARPISVEEFICPKDKSQARQKDLLKTELTYTQMDAINQELKKIWLKD